MKNILVKIKINYLTYFFLISAILCGRFKECLILYGIVIFHEIGHVIIIKLCNYQIDYIDILPFGGITHVDKPINSSLNKELFISVAGIIMQLILWVLMYYLYVYGWINDNTFILFKKYNLSILIFNLLPIIPLDGSKLSYCLLNYLCSYTLSYKLNFILSCLTLIIFIIFNYVYQLNNYIIAIFLIYMLIKYIKSYKIMQNKFLLERYLNDYHFSKLKIINNLKQMQMQKKHYALYQKKIISEKQLLSSYFNPR